MEKVIEIINLNRDYQTKIGIIKQKKITVNAIKNITFSVSSGEIFGILGPNGAGKTTLIKVMTTLLFPTSGTVNILGYDVVKQDKEIRPRINFVFGGERSLYGRVSAEDNLQFFCDQYLIPRKYQKDLIEKLLKKVNLYDKKKYNVETFSRGMKQKLHIARSLINNPDIIFLDEPSIGLDPIASKELKILIKELSLQGKTIILTTHIMSEAEELCDRFAILNRGQLIDLGNFDYFKQKYKDDDYVEPNLADIYVKIVEEVK